MEQYKPPFTYNGKILNLVAQIAALVERYAVRLEQPNGLMLRKANRIKTIHSSLAIEGNELTEDEVRSVLQGKSVLAPPVQLQEVRNAIRTYDLFEELDPFHTADMLRAHGVMMAGLCDDAGRFRRGGVGVFAGAELVHMAPPPNMVPTLMEQLFTWLRESDDHLLIRSCVFHYEFEFIHPFSDGNGRMGRLWQSLILDHYHSAFAALPVENMVYSHQAEYYEAIAQSGRLADCAPFIEYMLGELLRSLQENIHVPASLPAVYQSKLSDTELYILQQVQANGQVTARDIAQQLGLTTRRVEHCFASLRKQGILAREGARRNGAWVILPPEPSGESSV